MLKEKLHKTCALCNKEFLTARTNQVHCSEICRGKAYYQRHKGDQVTARAKAMCKECAAEFIPARYSKGEFCCKDCSNKFNARTKRKKPTANNQKFTREKLFHRAVDESKGRSLEDTADDFNCDPVWFEEHIKKHQKQYDTYCKRLGVKVS